MNQDPWRLRTEAVTRATARCFRLPVLDVPASLDALEDPEAQLDRLFGRYLPGSEAPRDARIAMGNATTPGTLGSNTKPAWVSTTAGDAARWPGMTTRQELPLETATPAGPVPDRTAGARRPDPPAGQDDHGGRFRAAGDGGRVSSGRPPTRIDDLAATAGAGEAGSRAQPRTSAAEPDIPPRVRSRLAGADLPAAGIPVGSASTPELPSAATPAAPAVPAATTRSSGVLAGHPEPVRQQPGSTTPQLPVTRLGRGIAQLTSVLRADGVDRTDGIDGNGSGTEQPPAAAGVSPSQAGRSATAPPADPADQSRPYAPAGIDAQADQALVATIADEVAGRLRDELEWEFQRTYGLGW
ncbi:hypothetical protein [Flindersiella endophytica]